MPLIVSHCVGVALWLRNTIDQLKHMLVLLYRRSRIIILLLHTMNKGKIFIMLLKLDWPAESHTFFIYSLLIIINFIILQLLMHGRFLSHSLCPHWHIRFFNSMNNYFYFYLADFNIVKLTRGLQFHACVWISGRSSSSRSVSSWNTSNQPSLAGREFSASPSDFTFQCTFRVSQCAQM